MTEEQKKLCRTLLDMCYDTGFRYYPIHVLAAKHGLTAEEVYDNNTNTGILWELGPHGDGSLDVQFASTAIMVSRDTKEMLERYCDYGR